jgi:hypothetical protein
MPAGKLTCFRTIPPRRPRAINAISIAPTRMCSVSRNRPAPATRVPKNIRARKFWDRFASSVSRVSIASQLASLVSPSSLRPSRSGGEAKRLVEAMTPSSVRTNPNGDPRHGSRRVLRAAHRREIAFGQDGRARPYDHGDGASPSWSRRGSASRPSGGTVMWTERGTASPYAKGSRCLRSPSTCRPNDLFRLSRLQEEGPHLIPVARVADAFRRAVGIGKGIAQGGDAPLRARPVEEGPAAFPVARLVRSKRGVQFLL